MTCPFVAMLFWVMNLTSRQQLLTQMPSTLNCRYQSFSADAQALQKYDLRVARVVWCGGAAPLVKQLAGDFVTAWWGAADATTCDAQRAVAEGAALVADATSDVGRVQHSGCYCDFDLLGEALIFAQLALQPAHSTRWSCKAEVNMTAVFRGTGWESCCTPPNSTCRCKAMSGQVNKEPRPCREPLLSAEFVPSRS
jgi:hypothetical protein